MLVRMDIEWEKMAVKVRLFWRQIIQTFVSNFLLVSSSNLSKKKFVVVFEFKGYAVITLLLCFLFRFRY